jgi:hypothetical protein
MKKNKSPHVAVAEKVQKNKWKISGNNNEKKEK